MKQKLKHYFQCLALLFFLLMFYQCQKVDDLQTPAIEPKTALNITIVHGNEHFAKSNPKIYNILKQVGHSNVISRDTEYSEDYDFSFNLDNIQIIEKSSYTQYTVVVESENAGDALLNYVLLDYHDGDMLQYLVTYPRIAGDIDNANASIQILNGQSIMGRGTGPIDCADNAPQLVDVTQQYICIETKCGGDNHGVGDDCDCGTIVSGNYIDCTRAYNDCGWQSVNVWGCTGSSDGGDPDSSGNPGGSSAGGNEPDPDPDDDDPLETVALDYATKKSDCIKLKKLANSPSFQTRMQELLIAVSGNQEVGYYGRRNEEGFTVYEDEDRHEGFEDEVGINPAPPLTAIDSDIHSHFNDGLGVLSVFSGSDLYSTHQLYDNNLIESNSEYIKVLVSPGDNITIEDDTVYALKINNSEKFSDFGNLYLSDPLLADVFFQRKGIVANNSITQEEKLLVELLNDVDSGLIIYRGDRNNLDNWTQLKIKNNGEFEENNCD